MSNILSQQWLQHYYEPWSIDDLNRQLMFTESLAEKHMLETEIKRREEADAQVNQLPRTS